ncbi:calcium homeostasis endoplasmic reticulum related protein [Cyclospora cayetanensis]|uniref:Calcium homeostasis endoplasmic reticulum related protein n=1 Tax=Cyclospora cayetanensis TaxID=88456 RepID=A0A1D3D6C8_9EIME|nr:calcium homeostasis endoplasmic reticulum related protein [Cyclospora cayetanensis]
MERMVRQRDGSDPRFSFLSGGEGYEYFRAFKVWLPWMAREAFQAASGSSEGEQKVDRVLSLWVERGVLSADERHEVAFFCRISQQQFQQALNAGRTLSCARCVYCASLQRRTGGSSTLDSGGLPTSPEPSRGFDMRPEELGLTPETVSVGIMATMCRSIIKRHSSECIGSPPLVPFGVGVDGGRQQERRGACVAAAAVEPPSDYLSDRLQDFYEDLDHIEENFRRKLEKDGRRSSLSPSPERDGSLSSDSLYSRSRSSSASLERKLEAREKERRLEAPEGPPPKPGGLRSSSNWIAAEMGLADDGTFAGPRGGARLGLGATADPPKPVQPVDLSDPFERFRHQRAGRYHEVMAAHKADRKDMTRQERNCYLCGKVGCVAC